MEIQGNSNTETSTAPIVLGQLLSFRGRTTGPLNVLWHNAPARPPEANAWRAYLATPSWCLRLVGLPAYSPDFSADEAI